MARTNVRSVINFFSIPALLNFQNGTAYSTQYNNSIKHQQKKHRRSTDFIPIYSASCCKSNRLAISSSRVGILIPMKHGYRRGGDATRMCTYIYSTLVISKIYITMYTITYIFCLRQTTCYCTTDLFTFNQSAV